MSAHPALNTPPRVINFHSEASPADATDLRPTLVVRLDRKPSNEESHAVVHSGAFGDLNAYQRVTLRWPNASEESLNSLGFLSPEIERFREHVRASPRALAWIQFARKLATFGLNILHRIEIPLDFGPRLATAALFKRTHESMQAAIILAEHGIISDARSGRPGSGGKRDCNSCSRERPRFHQLSLVRQQVRRASNGAHAFGNASISR